MHMIKINDDTQVIIKFSQYCVRTYVATYVCSYYDQCLYVIVIVTCFTFVGSALHLCNRLYTMSP